jgi:hypothetical protein
MPYPADIRRCHHLKVNGIQCGSPAQRYENFCYFHTQNRRDNAPNNAPYDPSNTNSLNPDSLNNKSCLPPPSIIEFPNLEDANSIQVALANVMRLLISKQIEDRTATILFRALRTAASNVRFTSFEPKQRTQVVIDPTCVENRPLGSTAWSTRDGIMFDILADEEAAIALPGEPTLFTGTKTKTPPQNDGWTEEARICMADLMHLTRGVAADPTFLDQPEGDTDAERALYITNYKRPKDPYVPPVSKTPPPESSQWWAPQPSNPNPFARPPLTMGPSPSPQPTQPPQPDQPSQPDQPPQPDQPDQPSIISPETSPPETTP